MPDSKATQKASYPLPAYNFRVTVDAQAASFTEVSGLTVEYETATYRHGFSRWEGEAVARVPKIGYQTIMLKKGTTVNAVARLYGVQPWQIYDWRKKARLVARQTEAATLVPVQVTEPDQAATEPKQSCSVVIEAPSARITITGLIDAVVVRTVLECLAR